MSENEKIVKELACDLSDDELQKAGLELADNEVLRERVRREKQVYLKEYGAKEKNFAIKAAKLAEEIKTKKQIRKVICIEQRDEQRCEINTIREDLGMIIETRSMTLEERQLKLAPVLPLRAVATPNQSPAQDKPQDTRTIEPGPFKDDEPKNKN